MTGKTGMNVKKGCDNLENSCLGEPEQPKEKLSRRDFARTSVVAGAAAVGLPSVLGAETGSAE